MAFIVYLFIFDSAICAI